MVMETNVEFTRIFKKYSKEVKNIINKQYHSNNQLESLVWEKIYNRINHEKLEYSSDLISLPYVRKIIKNTYLNFIQSEKYRNQKIHESEMYNNDRCVNISENLDSNVDLNDEKLFKNLKPIEIQLIKFRFYENKSIKEIDLLLNIKNSAVYISRILKKIRSNVSKYNGLNVNLCIDFNY